MIRSNTKNKKAVILMDDGLFVFEALR